MTQSSERTPAEELREQITNARDALTEYGRNAMDISGSLEDGIDADHRMAAAERDGLLGEVERLRRGGKQLGKVIDKNAEIMRATVLDGAASPRLALERLADWLAEADALTAGEHSQVITALRSALDGGAQ